MNKKIKNILIKISHTSENLNNQSDALNQSANEVMEGNLQVAATMEELSSGAETQANGAASLSETMNDFAQMVMISEDNGSKAAASSENVLYLTSDGQKLMNASVSQMNKIDQIVKEAVAKIKNLDHQAQ